MRIVVPTLLAFALSGFAVPVAAEAPFLVKDINSLPESDSSLPDFQGVVDDVAFFSATHNDIDRELWRTDGTEDGTWQIADICPGTCSPLLAPLLATPGGFFFIASDENYDRQLWISHGEPEDALQLTTGNLRIERIPRPVWDDRRKLLFFDVYDEVHGETLWRSDGTPAGTYRVADVSLVCDFYDFIDLTLFADKVFFCGDDGSNGPSLWATDGTAPGTRRVKSFGDPSGTNNGGPRGLLIVGRLMVFPATLPSGEVGLWRSDGTTRGTYPLVSLGTRKEVEIHPYRLTVGSRLYFTVKTGFDSPSALWVTNGTAQGTRKLASFPTPSLFLPRSALGQRILFTANDRKHGVELWTTDGTPGGTRLFKDFCPGPCSSGAIPLLVHKNRFVVVAETPDRGEEIWTTDGTAAGTRLLRDICPGPCDADPWVLGVRNNRLIFLARDAAQVPEVWSSDGTSQGTSRVRRLDPDAHIGSGRYGSVAVLPAGFLFIVSDPMFGQEPWITDGTAAGTHIVRDIASSVGSSNPQDLMRLGNEVFFFAADGTHGYELWKSDGSDEGTRLVAELTPGRQGDPPRSGKAVQAGGRLFFVWNDGIWRTDGTQAGTLKLTPDGLRLGSQFAAAGSRVFFSALDPEGFEDDLWFSDGTSAGTRKIAELPSSYPEFFTPFQGRLYFATNGGLWSSDGTPEGTGRFPTSPELFRNVHFPTVYRGFLFFFAYSEDHGNALWRTDGTAAGTVLAVDVAPGFENFYPERMIVAGDRLFFSERGLWVSDGTEAGTLKINDELVLPSPDAIAFYRGTLYVGTGSGSWKTDGTAEGTGPFELEIEGIRVPRRFIVFADRLYLLIESGLVETDGTPEGTRLLRPTSSSWKIPIYDAELVPAGSHLFFPAFEEDSGTELWALPAAGSGS